MKVVQSIARLELEKSSLLLVGARWKPNEFARHGSDVLVGRRGRWGKYEAEAGLL